MAETLRVNPIACTGHGVCAELQPELITADEPLVNALGSRFPVRWLGAFNAI